MMTPNMRYKETLTFAGSDTQATQWVYCDGYTKADVNYVATTTRGDVVLQGTNAPAVGGDPNFQPDPSATEIRDLATVATIAADSTAMEGEEYDNVLSMWVRVKIEDTAGSAGTVDVTLNLKATS